MSAQNNATREEARQALRGDDAADRAPENTTPTNTPDEMNEGQTQENEQNGSTTDEHTSDQSESSSGGSRSAEEAQRGDPSSQETDVRNGQERPAETVRPEATHGQDVGKDEKAETAHAGKSTEKTGPIEKNRPSTEPAPASDEADNIPEQKKTQRMSRDEILEAARASNSQRPQQSTQGTRRFLVILGVIVLIASGLGILGSTVYVLFFTGDETQPTISISQDLIAANTGTRVHIGGLSRSETAARLRNALQQTSPPSAQSLVVLPVAADARSGNQIALSQLFDRIAPNAPSALVRSLQKPYVIGAIGSNRTPFLVTKVRSEGRAFGHMLEWESAMYRDLKPLFYPDSTFNAKASFEDKLVRNTNVRVLSAADGTELIAYMFLDNTTLAITTDIQGLRILQSARISAQTSQ